MFKKLKKELQINIEENEGQLYLGPKAKNIHLLMLRPIDIIEFSEFAGSDAEDVLVWVGKSLGQDLLRRFFYFKDWAPVDLSTKKEVIIGCLQAIELLGFGVLKAIFKKSHVLIIVYDSFALDEKENIMAKNLCLLYQGILTSIFETLLIETDAEEIECCLLNSDKCVFKFELLNVEFEDEDIDGGQDEESVSDFLSAL